MLSIGAVVLGVTDMGRAVDFWCEALGYRVQVGGAAERWSELAPAGGPGTVLALQHSDSPAEAHPRVHLDLVAADAAEQAAEIQRIVRLGAQRVDWDRYPVNPDFVVLADPDGNCFCVVDASHE